MKHPLQINFLGMDASPAVEAFARGKATKLERYRSDLVACRVSVEALDLHRRRGWHFAVRIDVTVPGNKFVVDHVHDEDIFVALREAFDDMRRQVQDSARRLQTRHAPSDTSQASRWLDGLDDPVHPGTPAETAGPMT